MNPEEAPPKDCFSEDIQYFYFLFFDKFIDGLSIELRRHQTRSPPRAALPKIFSNWGLMGR